MKSVFISYAHQDQEFCAALVTHLRVLQNKGLITAWHDGEIAPGSAWQSVIDDKLQSADIIVMLVSADFLASRSCQEVELAAALERWEAKKVTIIPVIVRDCDWQASALAAFQALPSGARPVRQWPDRDEAWANVTRQIRAVVESSLSSPIASPSNRPLSSAVAPPPEVPPPKPRNATPGSSRRVERASFLAACDPAAAALFTFVLDESIRRGHGIYWGTTGFSAGAFFPDPADRWSFVYGYPPDDFQFYFQDGAPWSNPEDAARFRKVLLSTGIFREAGKLTLKARIDNATSARAHEAARQIFDHVEDSIARARKSVGTE